MDISNDAIHLIDEHGKIIYANQGMCRALGYRRDELLELSVSDITPHAAGKMVGNALDTLCGVQAAPFATSLIDKSGQAHPVEISLTTLEYEGERLVLAVTRDLSERKQLEERLAWQDHALNHVGEALYVIDEQARILQVNQAATNMLGYSRDEFFGMRINEIDPIHDSAVWRTHWEDLLQRGTVTLETVHRSNTGEIIPVEVNANAVKHRGQYLNFALVRDIRERKQAEHEIARREQQFRMLAENSNNIIIRYDLQCRRIYVNQAHSQLVGALTDEPALGHTPHMAWISINITADAYIERLRRVMQTGQRDRVMLEWKDSEGLLVSHLFDLVPEFDSEGGITGALGLGHDVTDLKRTEALLQQRAEEFRILAENSPDLIFRYDLNCRRVYVNPAVEKMSGMSAAALLGKSPLDEALLASSAGQQHIQNIRTVLQSGMGFESENELTDDAGKVRYFHNRYAPEIGQDGKLFGVVCIGRELTDFRHAEYLVRQREREFRTLVENLPTCVVRIDRELRRVYANPAYIKTVGVSSEDFLNEPIHKYWFGVNLTVNDYIEVLKRVLRTGKHEEIVLDWMDAQGEIRCHHVRIEPEFTEDDMISGLLVLGVDVTERQREQRLESKRLRVFETIARDGALSEIFSQVSRLTDTARPGLRSTILLQEEQGERLHCVAAHSFPDYPSPQQDGIENSSSDECCAVVALQGERVVMEDIARQMCAPACQAFARKNGIKACWSEPIIGSSGQALGVVTGYLERTGAPLPAEVETLRQSASLCAIAIERKRIQEQMHRHASYDSLTGLPNRRLFGYRLHEEVAKAQRSGVGVAVFFIDLDHFKEINDSLGHEVGDQLLIQAAKRIPACLRESDTVARLGGDEFVIILSPVEDLSHLGHLAQHILDALSQPFQLGKHTAYVSASIGIAGYPLDANNADALIGCADQAMYAAKEKGRNNFSFFTAEMQRQVQARLQLSHDLREAMEQRQFHICYQPIIDIATGEVVKAEALLRWKHPVRGMVSPEVFIPVAEENGFIHDIGDWVFRQSVQLAQRWNAQYATMGETRDSDRLRQVSVNLSPRQFMKGSIDEIWLQYLRQMAIDPACIALEITEGILLDDRIGILKVLDKFGAAGLQIALDDFGTGYSAMAYLKKFPIDYLKIDRSFVRDIELDANDRAIAEAIVVMAHKLGLKVIAEGVETELQRDILAAVGCEYVQGYLYAKPMPEEEFLAYVSSGSQG